MPRRKSTQHSEDDCTSPEGQLSSFLSAFAKAQADSNRQLVESLIAASLHVNSQEKPVAPSPAPSCTTQNANFANCTARFSGSSRDPDVLEAFIDCIEIYKEATNVSDQHALRGLPMLLEDEAALWYRGVKATVLTWDDALRKLRTRFGVAKPPHKILREIYATEQGDERAEIFIERLRALIMKIPYVIDMNMQVDIVYGLLDKRIRKRMPRESVLNLDFLLEKAIDIEESLTEAPTSLPRAPCNESEVARAQYYHGDNGSRSRVSNATRSPAEATEPRIFRTYL